MPRTPIVWYHFVQGHIPSPIQAGNIWLIAKKLPKNDFQNGRYQNHRKVLKRIVGNIVPHNQLRSMNFIAIPIF